MSTKLEEIQKDLMLIEVQIIAATQEKGEVSSKLEKLKNKRTKLKQQENKAQQELKQQNQLDFSFERELSTKHPFVCDHAILRYLERKKKMDIDAIRAEILTEQNISAIKAGATKIKTDGIILVIKNGGVITVLPK